ncbi:metallophosphoesterase [Marinilabiliaceae bacterium JC017]|nr:metallophosphoesterase [Marinilabiliaceae bacterium JC017]
MTKIALISDIHFGKFSRTNDFIVPGEKLTSTSTGEKSLKNDLIRQLKDEGVEYIVVTGDLTSVGSPSEFNYCKLALEEIVEKVGINKDKIIVGLGNHDIDWNISKLSSNHECQVEKLKQEITDNYLSVAGSVANHWFPHEIKYDHTGPAPFSGVVEFDSIIYFVLNSGWLCSEKDAIKQGKLDTKQLRWISEVLKKYKESTKWKILILHHHPFSYPYPKPSSDHSVLKEGPELNDIIGEYGVNIVCHGHRHHPRVKNELENGWANPITFISSGSLSVNVEHRSEEIPNLFHVIELDEDKSFYLRSYKFSSLNGWIRVTENTNHTPIDFEMFFQKPIEQGELNIFVKKLCQFEDDKNQKELPSWKGLPNELKSIKIESLNQLISEECKAKNIKVFGKYPDEEIVIIKK